MVMFPAWVHSECHGIKVTSDFKVSVDMVKKILIIWQLKANVLFYKVLALRVKIDGQNIC